MNKKSKRGSKKVDLLEENQHLKAQLRLVHKQLMAIHVQASMAECPHDDCQKAWASVAQKASRVCERIKED